MKVINNFSKMFRNFTYFKKNEAIKPLEAAAPAKPKVTEDRSSKAKKLLLASRSIRRNGIRPGVPHQNLIGLLRRTSARYLIPHHSQPQPKKAKPSTSTSRSNQTDRGTPFEHRERRKKVESIHRESEELFKECSMFKNENPSSWRNADANRKLVYYWTTINTVCPDPVAFKNFLKMYTTKNSRAKKMPQDKVHRKCWGIWTQMRHHERLPFIAESLISHFSKLPNPASRKLESQLKSFFVASRKCPKISE